MRKSIFLGPMVIFSAIVIAVLTLGTFGSAAYAKSSSGAKYNLNWSPAQPKSTVKNENRFNIPNLPVVTQDGESFMFYDDLIKDKKVLINFMYNKCEDSCPLATAKMAQIQRRLGDRIGRSIFIYSITLDPENDTVEVLKKYAKQYGAGPGWTFLTGKPEDINKITYKLGERLDKENHNNIIRIGTGRSWMRMTMFGELDYIVNEIGKTLDENWYAGREVPVKSYLDAPEMESKTLGNLMFNNRCSACHTIGYGDHIGPDLRGVTTRRDHDWLKRYIYNPERMRARKDPIALKLSAKYEGVLMPNLELATYDVLGLIEYIEDESSRLDKLDEAKHEGHLEKQQTGKHEEHHHGHDHHGHDH